MTATPFNAREWLSHVLVGEPPPAAPESDADWQSITQSAGRNGVVGLLYFSLSKNKAIQVPDHVLQPLKNNAHRLARNELVLAAELRSILKTWDKAGLRPLIFKGTALAHTLYEEPWLRNRCDTDVLFGSREQALAAHDLLEPLGYRKPNAISGDFIAHQFPSRRDHTRGLPHAFDMHWRINNRWTIADTFSFDDLAGTAQPVKKLGPLARTFSTPHAFLMACMHRMGHVKQKPADRLIWLFDIYLLTVAMNDDEWSAVARLSKEKELDYMVGQALAATRASFDITVPEPYRSQFIDAADEGQYRPDRATTALQAQLMDMKAMPGPGARLRYAREVLFPPRAYMLAKYEGSTPIALPWLYLKRIVLGLPKAFRAYNKPSTNKHP